MNEDWRKLALVILTADGDSYDFPVRYMAIAVIFQGGNNLTSVQIEQASEKVAE